MPNPPKKHAPRSAGASDSRGKKLSPAAERALAEAKARRARQTERQAAKEIGGRDGPDPARYGDWEVKGIASDF